ncbi:signal peptidase complex subunit 1 family protein [Psychrobacter sp. I-STPA10]|uniref:signal peptidase complex subunit 1 family protein n=1 Tax=Psychrobacter sp. I-STPA10 TaxID=2585769 RepID=UPI001E46AA38|nr:signal peptidase complex subunit 1 family protein [Psychrobacter sp. I-STPA10]
MSNKKWLIVLILSTIISFILGYQLKSFLYTDTCLDMGGGMNPEGYGICVVSEPTDL